MNKKREGKGANKEPMGVESRRRGWRSSIGRGGRAMAIDARYENVSSGVCLLHACQGSAEHSAPRAQTEIHEMFNNGVCV